MNAVLPKGIPGPAPVSGGSMPQVADPDESDPRRIGRRPKVRPFAPDSMEAAGDDGLKQFPLVIAGNR